MQYGICNLSIVPVKSIANNANEMITQLLYGDHFKVLERQKKWSKIRIAFDSCEGWIDNEQYKDISKESYEQIEALKTTQHVADLVSYCIAKNNSLLPVLLGSRMDCVEQLPYVYDGKLLTAIQDKSNLINTALLYLNAPHLCGGKTPFGIDCSGFTQMVYKINGFPLLRKASEQATQGDALSFIEESEAGDLAFFDNKEEKIDHVGIIMDNNYIIHSYGKVRIDRLDHTGIFNTKKGIYTHKLRVIKKIV